MKKLILVALIFATQTALPCMTVTMSQDDIAIGRSSDTQRREINRSQSEPSSPVVPAALMPHSSLAIRACAYVMSQRKLIFQNQQQSQAKNSSAAA